MLLTDATHEERFSPYHDDELAFVLVQDKDVLDFELELFSTKWFDYRTLTPLQATRLYVQAYTDVYRQVYAREKDAEAAPHINVMTVDRLFAGLCGVQEGEGDGVRLEISASKAASKYKRFFKACWNGRQVADAMGIPYRSYLNLAFEYRLRFWNQRFLPQPQHLYVERDVEDIQQRWAEIQAHSLFVGSHDAFLVQNYRGIAYQDDHHEWLFKQAGLRMNKALHLANFVRGDLLPLDKVQSRVDTDTFQRVTHYLN